MKPLLIFQVHSTKSVKMAEIVTEIQKGFDEGCLVLNDSVTILAFDEKGNLTYVTPK